MVPPTPETPPKFAPQPHPVALVTGASSGLGRELARRLVLDHGMDVLATARRLDRLEALRNELPEGSIQILHGDLADPEFRARLWAWAVGQSGRVDLLINNAGLGNYEDLAEQDFEVIQRIVDINLMALIDLTQRAIRHMRPRRSRQILQISSTLASLSPPLWRTWRLGGSIQFSFRKERTDVRQQSPDPRQSVECQKSTGPKPEKGAAR